MLQLAPKQPTRSTPRPHRVGNPWASPTNDPRCLGSTPLDYATFRLRRALEDYPNIVYALRYSCSVDAADTSSAPDAGAGSSPAKSLRSCPLWQTLTHTKADVDRCLQHLSRSDSRAYIICRLHFCYGIPVAVVARRLRISGAWIYKIIEKSLESMALCVLLYQ